MYRKRMYSGVLIGLTTLALMACNDNSSSAAMTSEAKQVASGVESLTKGARTDEEAKKLGAKYYETDLGQGLGFISVGGGYAGATYYLTGNFVPRDYTKQQYTDMPWPFVDNQYQSDSAEALAVADYVVHGYSKEDAIKFLAMIHVPGYVKASHFERDDFLNNPEVSTMLNGLYERAVARPTDVRVPVDINPSVTYNPNIKKFELQQSSVEPDSFMMRAEIQQDPRRMYSNNLYLGFTPFGVTSNRDDTVAEAIEPGYTENAGKLTKLSFELPNDKARQLDGYLNRKGSSALKYNYLGRVMPAGISTNYERGDLMFVPDALEILTNDNELITVLPAPTKVVAVHSSLNRGADQVIRGSLNGTNTDYIAMQK